MARLARLRQWWRSHFRRRVTAEGCAVHRAMNLLPIEYRPGGTPPERGSWVLSVSTATREPGTQTPVMATTAVCSSFSLPGEALGASGDLTLYRLASNYTAPILYGVWTGTPGVSGGQRDNAA